MIESFLDFMTQEVSLEPYTGQDAYSQPSFGPATTYPARVVGRTRLVRTILGDERVSTVTVYLGRLAQATPRDRLTLPAEFIPRQPPILAIEKLADERGMDCEVVYA